MKNVFWLSAAVVVLLALGVGAYLGFPRQAAVQGGSWFEKIFAKEFFARVEMRPAVPPASPSKIAAPSPSPATVPIVPGPPPEPPPVSFNLKKFAADRAAWPAKVKLTKAAEFSVVAKGQYAGAITAPAGTEVGLVTISGGKLAVEYRGGGAWVFADETDLAERTRDR